MPAEHTMDGNRADVEMQIYHSIPKTENKVGQRAALILSIFYNVTANDNSHLKFLQG